MGALAALVAIAFLAGSVSHAGVRIPLGVATIDEPRIIPAVFVEGASALALTFAVIALAMRRPVAWNALRAAAALGVVGVLAGNLALALGRGPRTEFNDVLHVVFLTALLGLLAAVHSAPVRTALSQPTPDASNEGTARDS
jgi:hypothetical protein